MSFNQVCILLIAQEQLFAGPSKNQTLDARFRSVKSICDQKSYRQPVQNDCNLIPQVSQKTSTLTSVVIDGQKYLQVPERLIGSKLERYFTETSAAAVLMSCCEHKNIQVHRPCLRDMFHAQEHQCSDQCPGCRKKVTRAVFAASRPNYLAYDQRKENCDYCHKSLCSSFVVEKKK